MLWLWHSNDKAAWKPISLRFLAKKWLPLPRASIFAARNAKLFSFQRATGQRRLAARHLIHCLSTEDGLAWRLGELHIGRIDPTMWFAQHLAGNRFYLHRLPSRKIMRHAIHDVDAFYPCMANFGILLLCNSYPDEISKKLLVNASHASCPLTNLTFPNRNRIIQPGVPHWATNSTGTDGGRKSAAGSTCTCRFVAMGWMKYGKFMGV